MKKIILLICVLGLAVLGSCGKKEENKQPLIPDIPAVKTDSIYHFSLTGMETKENVDQRAIAVMINNHPDARPQMGISKADIIFEFMVEGESTRFMAIFQSEYPDEIGPIRSARDYFIETAKGLNCLYIAHGFSPNAKELLDNEVIDNLNGMYYDGTLFKRSSMRIAPHNSYITIEKILKGATEKKYQMTGQTPAYQFFSEQEVKEMQGKTATEIKVSYHSSEYDVTYQYDANTKKYARYTSGIITKDDQSKIPVQLDNLLVIEAKHSIATNEVNREIDINSGGKAYLFQQGLMLPIEWQNINGKITPMQNGIEVKLIKGKTWINVIPTNPGLASTVILK